MTEGTEVADVSDVYFFHHLGPLGTLGYVGHLIMPLITYTTVCTFKKLIARGVYELRFTKPEGFTFIAGQFILFDVPLVDKPEDVQTRALSIASSPAEDDLLFVVKLLPGGRLGRWIEEVLAVGSSVTFKGPFGNFVLDRGSRPSPPSRDPSTSLRTGATDPLPQAGEGMKPGGLFFIATGAGVAPFRPMVMEAAKNFPDRRIDILFGVRSEDDIFWNDWLEETSNKHTNVFYHIPLTQPSPSWTGHKGRVQVVAPQVIGNDFTNKTLYVCGNPDMTTEVKRLALEEWGLEKRDVHVEGYI